MISILTSLSLSLSLLPALSIHIFLAFHLLLLAFLISLYIIVITIIPRYMEYCCAHIVYGDSTQRPTSREFQSKEHGVIGVATKESGEKAVEKDTEDTYLNLLSSLSQPKPSIGSRNDDDIVDMRSNNDVSFSMHTRDSTLCAMIQCILALDRNKILLLLHIHESDDMAKTMIDSVHTEQQSMLIRLLQLTRQLLITSPSIAATKQGLYKSSDKQFTTLYATHHVNPAHASGESKIQEIDRSVYQVTPEDPTLLFNRHEWDDDSLHSMVSADEIDRSHNGGGISRGGGGREAAEMKQEKRESDESADNDEDDESDSQWYRRGLYTRADSGSEYRGLEASKKTVSTLVLLRVIKEVLDIASIYTEQLVAYNG